MAPKAAVSTKEASWTASLLAMARYELLSSFRRKKLIGVLALGILMSAFTWNLPLLGFTNPSLPSSPNPDAVTGLHYDIFFGGEIGYVLLPLIIVMDSISGEFEYGTFATLLTKPVSRGIVYFGKMLGSVITLVATIGVILASGVLWGTLAYGPQENLALLVVIFLGDMLSAFIFVSMFYAAASFTKSTMLTVLVGIAYFIINQVVGLTNSWVKEYIPGYGVGLHPFSVAGGTSGIGPNLAYYLLHPGAQVGYGSFGTEALSLVVLTAVAVSLAYVAVFLSTGYYAFKRAEIK